MQISPSFSLTHLILAAALAKLGEIDKAKATAAHVLQLQPDFRLGRHFAGADYAPELATSLTEALGATGLPAARRLLHCISPPGTKLPIKDVCASVAIGGKPDNICSF